MALTRDQLIELAAAFGPSVLQGIGQGGQASADRALTEQDRARQAEQELYRRRQAGRADLTGFYQGQLNRDINAAGDFAAQSPLGAEQLLARNMARMRQVGQAAGQYRPPTGMSPAASAFAAQQPNFLAPFASADFQQTVSPEATARSIAERRKALGAIDPSFQFGSMGDFGLPSLDTEVAQYQGGVRDRRQTSENEQLRLLTEQMREASAAQIPGATGATTPGTAATGATADNKPSLLRRIAGAALPVAAAFIPGVGPVASALIQAGAGAAGSALAGGGLKGALTGAAMGGLGAATGGLGSAAARKAAGEGMGSFVQRAILDPRALTQIAGGALGGDAGMAAQVASLGMGRTPGAGNRTFDTSFEQQGLPNSMLPTGGMYAGMSTTVGASPESSLNLLPGAGRLETSIAPLPPARTVAKPKPLPPAAPRPVATGGLGSLIQQNLRQGVSDPTLALWNTLLRYPQLAEMLQRPDIRRQMLNRLPSRQNPSRALQPQGMAGGEVLY